MPSGCPTRVANPSQTHFSFREGASRTRMRRRRSYGNRPQIPNAAIGGAASCGARTIAGHKVFTVLISGDSRFVGRDRMYVVEIRRDGDGLAEPMAQIRTWLDRKRIQPNVFRLSLMAGATIFRVEFGAASDAEAFARAFGGQVIGGD